MIRNHHQANSTKWSCCISLEISLNPPEPSTFRGCSSCSHLAINLCSELPEPFHYFNAFKPTSINLPINIKQPSIELVFSHGFSTSFNVYLHLIQCTHERGQTSLCSALSPDSCNNVQKQTCSQTIHYSVQVYSTVVVSEHIVAACSYFNTVRLSVVLSGQLCQPRLLI